MQGLEEGVQGEINVVKDSTVAITEFGKWESDGNRDGAQIDTLV